MSDILTQKGPKTDTDYEAMSLRILAEMNRLEGLMDIKRAERVRLKVENAAIKASTEAKLIRLEQHLSKLQGAH
jgi:hypothetical protein